MHWFCEQGDNAISTPNSEYSPGLLANIEKSVISYLKKVSNYLIA